MASARSLPVARLRRRAAATSTAVGRVLRRRRARVRAARGDWTAAGVVGAAIVVLPWLALAIARPLGEVGPGDLVDDPWALAGSAWGAWALLGLLGAALLALVGWARLRLPAPDVSRTVIAAVLGFAGLAVWCAGSVVLWAADPAAAWRWTVLALAATGAVVLGLFAGSQRSGRTGIVLGLVTIGALTGAAGIVDLLASVGADRRLTMPLGPSASALVVAFGLVCSLSLDQSEHPLRRRWLRGASTLAVIALLLGASRGAVLVALIGVAVLAVRGMQVGWPLLQSVLGALPAVLVAVLPGGVARAGIVDDTSRLLVAALAAGAIALVAWSAGRDLGAPPWLLRPFAQRRGRVAAGGLAVIGVVAAALAIGGGPQELWSRTSDAATARSSPGVPADATRLWSGTGDGRVWRWQAAIDAYQTSGDPVLGLGPGAAKPVLLRYRRSTTRVLTVPSAPLALLTEAGAVGLALGLFSVLCLIMAARAERRRAPGPERAALAAVALGAGVWSLVNEGHLQPMAFIPGLAALAALAARPTIEQMLVPDRGSERPPLIRSAATALGAAAAVVLAIAALLPAFAEQRARAAEGLLATPDETSLGRAALLAARATAIDPLGVDGEIVGSQIALRFDRWAEARALALQAVRNDPGSASAWRALAQVALAERDRPGARAAARRLQQLDPSAPSTRDILLAATLESAPPQASPTAVGTPLTAESAEAP